MSYFSYYFGQTLPLPIHRKMAGLFPKPSCIADQQDCFIRDGFYPDGSPRELRDNCIYPLYAAHYIGYPIPSTYLDVKQHYRETASVAAIEWLTKLLPLPNMEYCIDHHNGEIIHVTDGIDCCFPDTAISYTKTDPVTGAVSLRYAPIIPWPDSNENDEAWERGSTPYYAEAQARLTLWCWKASYDCGHRAGEAPDRVYIVRITGNTPGDLTIRCIKADGKQDTAVFNRVVRAFKRSLDAKKPPLANLQRSEQLNWLDQERENAEDAYKIEDPGAYALVQRYMQVRSHRKTLEAELEQLEEEMNCIAISLASQTGSDKAAGLLSDGDTDYKVQHTMRRTYAPTVSADIVRQFFPEHSNAIQTTEYPRGRVTIDICNQ